ncbi:modification methylase [Helicobacter cetorum]|uniref:modification methylase n=1 Tax=Helicobacter cetorum TaxID=138563 RepID=UPI000CF154A7|nr:modification methylase [Helicobacter cetorum]
MTYAVIRNQSYDYLGQSYASNFPILHKYPAMMLPQIGIDILKELQISSGKLFDPYCGSGSSFISALERGLTDLYGFDINPLAIMITKAKFTKLSKNQLLETKQILRENIFEFLKNENNLNQLKNAKITNIDFWFSQQVIKKLNLLKYFIYQVRDDNLRNFFLIPFSTTIRECSYTRNNEFKLYRMKSEDILNFNPDVLGIYFEKLENNLHDYIDYFLPKINHISIDIQHAKFQAKKDYFDVVLTSPPYGDSKTTVAYGQFSTLSNEWLDINYARKIDNMLMGGIKTKTLFSYGLITDYVHQIAKQDYKRALEVSSFYYDLANSIKEVARSIKKGGKSIYVVGNRTVKNIYLPTDQFIAEIFEENGFKHLITYERLLSNKSMPSLNSPSNKVGKKVNTMLYEYIVVCEKI